MESGHPNSFFKMDKDNLDGEADHGLGDEEQAGGGGLWLIIIIYNYNLAILTF